MGRSGVIFAAMAAVAVVASVSLGLNQAAATDVIAMNADYPHTKPIVMFTHAAHSEDYAKKNPALFKDGCGTCHHDDTGTPLADLTMDDDVNACFDCHDKPGRPDKAVKKAWRKEKLSRAEKKSRELEYEAEALHTNCLDCHRAYKKKTKSKAAPTSCTKCHKKS